MQCIIFLLRFHGLLSVRFSYVLQIQRWFSSLALCTAWPHETTCKKNILMGQINLGFCHIVILCGKLSHSCHWLSKPWWPCLVPLATPRATPVGTPWAPDPVTRNTEDDQGATGLSGSYRCTQTRTMATSRYSCSGIWTSPSPLTAGEVRGLTNWSKESWTVLLFHFFLNFEGIIWKLLLKLLKQYGLPMNQVLSMVDFSKISFHLK